MGVKTTVMKSATLSAGLIQGGVARIYQSTSHSNSIFGGNNRSFTPYHTSMSHSVVSPALGAGGMLTEAYGLVKRKELKGGLT
jgi:hypothetical protein